MGPVKKEDPLHARKTPRPSPLQVQNISCVVMGRLSSVGCWWRQRESVAPLLPHAVFDHPEISVHLLHGELQVDES